MKTSIASDRGISRGRQDEAGLATGSSPGVDVSRWTGSDSGCEPSIDLLHNYTICHIYTRPGDSSPVDGHLIPISPTGFALTLPHLVSSKHPDWHAF